MRPLVRSAESRWKQRTDECGCQSPNRPWRPSHGVPERRCPKVMGITEEKLVPTVSGETHSHLVARQPGNEKAGNLGWVCERFIIYTRKQGDHIHGFPRRHIELGVVRAQMPGHLLGVHGFVVAVLMEANGKC